MTKSAKLFVGIAVGAALLVGASSASAATFLLKDTIGAGTDVLNTSGELTGGDAKVPASSVGTAFTDLAFFSITPGELLTSFDVTSQGTAGNGVISGGTAEIFVAGVNTPIAASLTSLATVGSAPYNLESFSSEFDLGPGNYYIKIVSTGLDPVGTKGAAKFSVELQGTAIPEPATWAVMLGGFGVIGASMRRNRRPGALTA